MPKRIVILDPNGVEVASELGDFGPKADWLSEQDAWPDAVFAACEALIDLLKRENPKLGTYTVTIKEVE